VLRAPLFYVDFQYANYFVSWSCACRLADCRSLILGLLAAQPAYGQWQFSIGAGARLATTREFTASGARLVEERGWLPGLELGASYRSGPWRVAINGEIYRHNLDYDGQLQNGVPFATTTGTVQDRLALEVGRQLNDRLSLLAGVELDRWHRQIYGSGTVLGLDERYRSSRLLLGAESAILKTAYFDMSIRALLVRAQPEHLDVAFGNQLFDDAALTTQAATGLRLGAELIPAAAPAMRINFGVETLRIGRSADARLTRNGVASGTVSQPEHRRNAVTLRVRYQF
jgi:hypothetical protein